MLDLGYHFSNKENQTNNVYCVGNIAKGRNLFKCFWRVQHHWTQTENKYIAFVHIFHLKTNNGLNIFDVMKWYLSKDNKRKNFLGPLRLDQITSLPSPCNVSSTPASSPMGPAAGNPAAPVIKFIAPGSIPAQLAFLPYMVVAKV